MEVHADGPMAPGAFPTAGRGCVQYAPGGSTPGYRAGEGNCGQPGRVLDGEQNTYKAGAWALLGVLAAIHPTTDANIHIGD